MNMSIDLVQKESFEYSNKDWTKTYDCTIKNARDMISLIEFLQDSYGEVEEILCIYVFLTSATEFCAYYSGSYGYIQAFCRLCFHRIGQKALKRIHKKFNFSSISY